MYKFIFGITLVLVFLIVQFLGNPNAPTIAETTDQLIQTCINRKSADFCYAKEFFKVGRVHHINDTVIILKELQERDARAMSCHFIAHNIAAAEMEKNNNDLRKVLHVLPIAECTGGYIMGALEGYKRVNKNFAINKQTYSKICALVSSETRSGEKSCAHVLGHLVLLEAKGMIKDAVSTCQSIDSEYQYECLSGVFMEDITRENLVHHDIKEDLDWNLAVLKKEEEKCNYFNGQVQLACWKELSHMMVYIGKGNPTKTYEYCSRAIDDISTRECYIHGIGVSVISQSFEMNFIGALCNSLTEEKDHDRCVSLVISTWLQTSPNFTHRVVSLCNIQQDNTDTCYSIASNYINRIYKGRNSEICSQLPKKYIYACVGEKV